MYHVRLEQFEGPLELLLSLIEKEKFDVTRISLAKVADQYIEHITQENNVPLENLSQFLSIASKLVLLKSRALLPVLSFSDEEEEEIADLEWRLREYSRYHEAARLLRKRLFFGNRSFCRESFLNVSNIFFPSQELEGSDLHGAFVRVLKNVSLPDHLDERLVEEIMTIEDRMIFLERRISRSMEITFSEVMMESNNRIEIVVSFLALLELVRRRTFEVEQGELFGEIRFRSAFCAS